MKFTSVAAAVFVLPLSVAFGLSVRSTVPATWDQTYDNPALPLTNVACSNGKNGLITKGFTDLGSLPNFPYLGGIFPVEWNSTLCGSCWEISYGSNTIKFLAVDYAGDGVNMSKEAMMKLAGQQGVTQGKIQVTTKQVAASECGMH